MARGVSNTNKTIISTHDDQYIYGSLYPDSVKGRFWSKVGITDDSDECWIWKGGINKKGYGGFNAGRPYSYNSRIAHRYAYIFHYGKLNTDLLVCHACDNPSCCNPYHLFSGTAYQNSSDMLTKGRSSKGERQGHTHLTSTDVGAIKALIQTGRLEQKEIAAIFQISQQSISKINTGNSWRYHK